MIEVKNVVKTFDGFAALNDATLSVCLLYTSDAADDR